MDHQLTRRASFLQRLKPVEAPGTWELLRVKAGFRENDPGRKMERSDIRNRVLRASKYVFSRKGYRATTVADILTKAGIARATFYKYFPNKRELFLEMFKEIFNTLFENARNSWSSDPSSTEEWLRGARETLVLFYTFFLENRDLLQVFYQEAASLDPRLYALWDDLNRRTAGLFTKALERGIENGVFRGMDTRLVSSVMLMYFLQLPYRYVENRSRSKIDVQSMADGMMKLLLEGIGV